MGSHKVYTVLHGNGRRECPQIWEKTRRDHHWPTPLFASAPLRNSVQFVACVGTFLALKPRTIRAVFGVHVRRAPQWTTSALMKVGGGH